MNWKIEFDKKASDHFLKLDRSIKQRILKFIDERLLKMKTPRDLGYPLKGTLAGFWKYCVGEYRLICKIEDHQLTILVIDVGHRKNIYKI